MSFAVQGSTVSGMVLYCSRFGSDTRGVLMVPSSGCRHYMYMLNDRVYLRCITAGSSSIQVYYMKGTVSYTVLYRLLCR